MAAPDIAAFKTRARGGFIPQAKHGANGLCAVAVAGSKFEGTGLENEQIGHIQVAELAGEGSGVGKWKLLPVIDKGDAVVLLEGLLRCWADGRLEGLGTRVIFAEDFKKPAWVALADQATETWCTHT